MSRMVREILWLLAETIAALEPCLFAGRVKADQIMMALGELLDIWSALIAL
jgi:hypothetical protein